MIRFALAVALGPALAAPLAAQDVVRTVPAAPTEPRNAYAPAQPATVPAHHSPERPPLRLSHAGVSGGCSWLGATSTCRVLATASAGSRGRSS